MQTVTFISTQKFSGPIVGNAHNLIQKGSLVVSPIKTENVTKNKEYVVTKVATGNYFTIRDDNNKVLYCKILSCGHLNGEDWLLK